MHPVHPIQAVTCADPYPYYRRLARERPLYHDAALGLWIASAPGIVSGLLNHEAACVRPADEPVPAALRDDAAGLLFGRLVRMRDDITHRRLKPLLADCVSALGELTATHWPAQPRSHAELDEFLFDAPIYAMAQRLGLQASAAPACARAVRQFRAGLSPGADVARRRAGVKAAAGLQARMAGHLQAQPESTPLGRLRAHAASMDIEPAVVAANLAGLLFQSCEAGAGLIGNTLVRLAVDPRQATAARSDIKLCMQAAAQAARHDPPIHNTRRYLRQAVSIDGHELPAGACVLLLLAAAGMQAADDMLWTYGQGRHACPGRAAAQQLAGRATHYLLNGKLDVPALLPGLAYWPLPNARVPRFGAAS